MWTVDCDLEKQAPRQIQNMFPLLLPLLYSRKKNQDLERTSDGQSDYNDQGENDIVTDTPICEARFFIL